jgi:hypothetical protein
VREVVAHAASEVGPEVARMGWISQAIERGAPWSYLLIALQVYLVAMLVERSVFLLAKSAVNVDEFLRQLRKLVDARNVDRALKLCSAAEFPVGRVCRAGLEGLGQGPFFLTEELDRVIKTEVHGLRRRLGTIPLLALGVAAFSVIASALTAGNAARTGAEGPLPFGLAEERGLLLLGMSFAILGGVWWLLLASKARRIAMDLERCKAFVLEIDQVER